MHLTPLEVSEQAARFEYFIQTANLLKIGETAFKMEPYAQITYIRRVLWQCARVRTSCYSPLYPVSKFYGDLLCVACLQALINKYTPLI